MRKWKGFTIFIVSLVVAVLSFLPGFISAEAAPEKMEVHFIDVGQGDCTLIKCGDRAMLIDAGDDSKGTAIQNYLQKQNIKKLDYLVLTHPDSDHIGGAPVIITKFDIEQVFLSDYEKDNRTYEKLIQALEYKRLSYVTPKAGEEYDFGSGVIKILGPVKKYDNPNDSSIVLIVENGENRFLFTGDAEEEAEKDLIKNCGDISADVYKAGHHGSKTSTCGAFFEAVNPKYAVISCGEGNSYGHPHAQTLNTFRMNGVKVYRTDEEGTIVATSDGTAIEFQVPASETWEAGEPKGSIGSSVSQTGKGSGTEVQEKEETKSSVSTGITYVLNTNTKKFHKLSCSSVSTIKDKNRKDTTDSRDEIIKNGFVPCKRCNP